MSRKTRVSNVITISKNGGNGYIRKCTKCGEYKDLTTDYFGLDRQNNYGYRTQCKECNKAYQQEKRDEIKNEVAYFEQVQEEIKPVEQLELSEVKRYSKPLLEEETPKTAGIEMIVEETETDEYAGYDNTGMLAMIVKELRELKEFTKKVWGK